jgi:hypothetical protein
MGAAPSLSELEQRALSELKGLYRALVSEHLPARVSRELLLGNIAWALQAGKDKRDPTLVRDRLVAAAGNKAVSPKARFLPGTRLIREWQGVTHEVVVEEKGFRWRNRSYPSLSQIARAITGARWSGPRFFGIKERSGTGSTAAAAP